MSADKLDAAGLSDPGLKRERNEDFFKILIPPNEVEQAVLGALFIVADGMGGMGGGDVASKSAVEEIIRQYYASDKATAEPLVRLQNALNAANNFVRKRAAEIELQRIGSTVAGIVLTPSQEAIVFNVGDSRVYRVRGNYIEPLSRDQSVMAEQIESGAISDEEDRVNSNLTAFLGQPLPLKPYFRRTSVQDADTFVICSDGVWSLIEPNEILTVVKGKSARKSADQLIRLARKRGAPDNITVIVLRMAYRKSRRGLVLSAAALLLIVGVATGILLVKNNLFQPPATKITAVTQAVSPTISSMTTTAQAVIEVFATDTFTPSLTFTMTPTSPPSSTPTPTLTALPSDTPTRLPTATSTSSASPTISASQTPTLIPTTPQPSHPAPSATLTDSPSTNTTEPTVTLNPSLLSLNSPTPAPTNSPTLPSDDTALIAQVKLDYAHSVPVVLQTSASLVAGNGVATQSLEKGTLVQILDQPSRTIGKEIFWWVRATITTSTQEGWLHETELEQAQPSIPQLIILAGSVNVRAGSGMAYAPIQSVVRGDPVSVVGKSHNHWYQVEMNGQKGWIAEFNGTQTITYLWGSSADLPYAESPTMTPTITLPESTAEVLPAATQS